MASTISRSQVSPHHSFVRVTGALDLVTAPLLRAALRSADADPAHEFAVELSAVNFMDCSGLSPLLEAHATLGGRLRLCDPSPAVSTLLHLVGIDVNFAIDGVIPTVASAATAAAATDHASPSDEPSRNPSRQSSAQVLVPDRAEDELSGLGVLEAHLAGPGAVLGNRVVVEQARGMLMASLDCDAKQASHALLQISWDHEVTVLDAALALIATAQGSLSQPHVPESAATDLGRGARTGAMVGPGLAMDTV